MPYKTSLAVHQVGHDMKLFSPFTIFLSLTVLFLSAFIYSAIDIMPTLAAARAANAAWNPSYTPVAIFVGGTSGIGQGITEAFARHTKGNAHIVIIGRNRAAAESIISQFPKPTDGAKYTHEFVQCDVTLMRNVESVTQDLLSRIPKINFLVMSPGYMTMKGRDESDEGLDKKLAVHYYSRWKFINNLLPALRRAQEAGEDSKVLSVLATGKGGEIDLDDLGLKKTFSPANCAAAAPTYNDLMLQEFSARNPGIAFAHAYPGIVRTPLYSSADTAMLRGVLKVTMAAVYPFSTSLQETGEYMLHGILSKQPGFYRVGSRAEDLGMKRYFGSDEARKALWEHSINATRVSEAS
ncbi:hypothetical protein H0H92_013593 [Tricholoma furcatifolium]|nr:hypothetical protein H0H92_013593 [Tricholoma furcatifolium]